MKIEGLDYNTQREKLVMPEYGREVQDMVNLCVTFSYIEHEPGTLLTPLFGQPAAPYDLRGPPTC